MRRIFWCLLALAGLLCTGLAPPAAASPEAAPAPVRLVAPAAGPGGIILRAGSSTELAWEPLPSFAALAQVEEWEAFLSLDGGAHYTVRVTPHLDRGLRRIFWQVPATPTRDARLLLRFGDERLETVFELPQRFVIAAPIGASPAASPEARLEVEPARRVLGRGEPARPGEAGVVAWIEGDRHGGGARRVVAAEPPAARSVPSLAEGRGGPAGLVTAAPALDSVTAVVAGRQPPPARRAAPSLTDRTAPAVSIPILLQTQRRNE